MKLLRVGAVSSSASAGISVALGDLGAHSASNGVSCVMVRTANGDDAMRMPFWFGKLRSPPSAASFHTKPPTRIIEPVMKKLCRVIVLPERPPVYRQFLLCKCENMSGIIGTANLVVTRARGRGRQI